MISLLRLLRWRNKPTLFHARARAPVIGQISSHVYKHVQASESC